METQLQDYRLSLAKGLTSSFWMGLSHKGISPSFLQGLNLKPLLATELVLQRKGEAQVGGGFDVSYLKYVLGGWMVRSELRLLAASAGLSLGGTGEYALGNTSLSLNMRLRFNSPLTWRSSPLTVKEAWRVLGRGSLFNLTEDKSSYMHLQLKRKFEIADRKLSLGGLWGKQFDPEENYPAVLDRSNMGGLLTYKKNYIGFTASPYRQQSWTLYLSSWAFYVQNSHASLAFLHRGRKHPLGAADILLLHYGAKTDYYLELTNKAKERFQLSLLLEYNW